MTPELATQVLDLGYSRALLNILDDTAEEQTRLRDTQSAVLNILEDFTEEKSHLEDMKRAVLNILEDLGVERDKLQETQNELLKSEQAIRASLREKETLLKEVHHRVKNNLQVIASLLRLQARYLRDEQTRAMFEESQNRVQSISLVHEMLYRAGDLARVDFGDYLSTLINHLTEGWDSAGRNIRISVESSGVQLPVDTAIPCGLIVNELITNAVKHAFPDGRDGEIKVRFGRTGNGWRLSVIDDGVGMSSVDRKAGLGTGLIESFVAQAGGTLTVTGERGTAAHLDLPPSVAVA